jgi:hypothetical protein
MRIAVGSGQSVRLRSSHPALFSALRVFSGSHIGRVSQPISQPLSPLKAGTIAVTFNQIQDPKSFFRSSGIEVPAEKPQASISIFLDDFLYRRHNFGVHVPVSARFRKSQSRPISSRIPWRQACWPTAFQQPGSFISNPIRRHRLPRSPTPGRPAASWPALPARYSGRAGIARRSGHDRD